MSNMATAVTKKKSVFEVLSAIDCSKYIEKKNNLTYLSWAWAWTKVKQNYPHATFTIYEGERGCLYHTDGKTCWVKTGVTIENIEMIEYLPVMDYRNQSIAVDKVTSMDANKAIQRSLTKACARHGLGLYIYAGEDLPEVKLDEEDLEEVRKRIEQAESIKELKTIWEEYKVIHNNKEITLLFTHKKNELKANEQ